MTSRVEGDEQGPRAAAGPVDDVAARYARPSGRRGRAGRRRRLAAAVAGGVLVVVAGVTVAGSVLSDDVRWQEVSFTVVDERSVQTTFEVYADPGTTVRCQVRAADARYNDVGQADVDVGPLQARATSVTVDVRTVGEAVTSSVRTCVPLP